MSEKRTAQRWLNRADRFVLIGIGVIFVLGGAVGLWRWWTHRDLDFDRGRWIMSIDEFETPTTRQRMCDDIIENHLKIGMTEAEILDLLGEPSEGYSYHNMLSFYLGPERGWFGIDSEWIRVELDEDGRLVEARWGTD